MRALNLLFLVSYLLSGAVCRVPAAESSWSRLNIPVPVTSVAEGNGRFVAIDMFPHSAGLSTVLISTNLTNWTAHPTPFTQEIYDFAFGNGSFVALGFQTSYVSADGLNWRAFRMPDSGLELAIGPGKFLTAGFGGFIMTSPDARTWTSLQLTNPSRSPLFTANAYGNGHYVVVDDSGLTSFTSVDTVKWERKALPADVRQFNALSFGNGFFVGLAYAPGGFLGGAAGGKAVSAKSTDEDRFWANNLVLMSTNGLDWATTYTTTNGTLRGVAYGNGMFTAFGTRGTFLSSTDAVHWHETQLPYSLYGLSFVNSRFVRFSSVFLELSSPIITLRMIGSNLLGVLAPKSQRIVLENAPSFSGPWNTIWNDNFPESPAAVFLEFGGGARVFFRAYLQ